MRGQVTGDRGQNGQGELIAEIDRLLDQPETPETNAEIDRMGKMLMEQGGIQSPETEESQGLGDTIAKLIKTVGIKPCGGCNRRRKKLNQWIPYRIK